MPGEPVCRRESLAGEPVVDSGYMEPASLVPTFSLLHRGKILEEKQKRRVKKDQSGLARRLCEGEGRLWGISMSLITQTDRPMGARMRLTVRSKDCEGFPSLHPPHAPRGSFACIPSPMAAFLKLSEHFFVAQTLQKWSERHLWTWYSGLSSPPQKVASLSPRATLAASPSLTPTPAGGATAEL